MRIRIARWRSEGARAYRRGMHAILRRVPSGARLIVGLLLIVGGVLGFLPVLGFWMIPLGVAVIVTDVASIRRRIARRRRNRRR